MNRMARTVPVTLEANTPTAFAYDLRFVVGAAGGLAVDNQCKWNLHWALTQVPVFPVYLFGQGLAASVYPGPSREMSHVQPEFVLGPVDCSTIEPQ